MNVLFSSIGRRVELVRAFRESLIRSGGEFRLVGADLNWMAPALQEVDVPCLVPRCDSEEFPHRIAEICREHEIDIVLPLIDTEIPFLNQSRELIEATGARLAVCQQAAIDIAADKWNAYHFFQKLGLPTPRSWLPADVSEIRDEDFPLFIKPRNGSASANTFKIRDRRELEFFIEYVPNPIIQEMIVGDEVTSDVVCDFAARPLAVVLRQRIEVRGGEAMKSVTIHHESISDACEQVAAALPAVGPITVQCIVRDNVPYFIEINARLGGGLPLAVAAGVDVPALITHVAKDGASALADYEAGVFMTRCDESFFIRESFRERIEGRHIRS